MFDMFIDIITGLLGLTVLVYLSYKFLKDKYMNLRTHDLTKILIFLVGFLFLEDTYSAIYTASYYGILPTKVFLFMSNAPLRTVIPLGIFISLVVLVHFIFDNRIEELRNNELAVRKLSKLNHELEEKARALEVDQEKLNTKVHELERFNDVAKRREESMVDLIKKIEKLENQLKRKK